MPLSRDECFGILGKYIFRRKITIIIIEFKILYYSQLTIN
jgi:hypothetical protein